jgi:hypothetical protein
MKPFSIFQTCGKIVQFNPKVTKIVNLVIIVYAWIYFFIIA